VQIHGADTRLWQVEPVHAVFRSIGCIVWPGWPDLWCWTGGKRQKAIPFRRSQRALFSSAHCIWATRASLLPFQYSHAHVLGLQAAIICWRAIDSRLHTRIHVLYCPRQLLRPQGLCTSCYQTFTVSDCRSEISAEMGCIDTVGSRVHDASQGSIGM
jgi:hypothetical protein